MNTVLISGDLPSVLINTLRNKKIIKLNGKQIGFETENELPNFVILNLEETSSLDYLLALREILHSDNLPVFGYISSNKTKARSLFFACGGTKIIDNEKMLLYEMKRLSLHKNKQSDIEFPIKVDVSYKENSLRYLKKLKVMTVYNKTASISGTTELLSKSVEMILNNLYKICQTHLSVLILNNNQIVESYILPSKSIFYEDYKYFMNFCLNDFYKHFHGLNMENIHETFYTGDRTDFRKIRMGKQKISSYYHIPVRNSSGTVIGSLHLGYLSNNYFTKMTIETIKQFVIKMQEPLCYSFKTNLDTLKQKKLLNIFSRFVPADIIPKLIVQEANRDNQVVEKREIAVLFSDIRAFTTLTELNNAQSVVDFLNRHFDAMVGIIKKYGGTIDKFIGDAIVALFGVPESFEDNAMRAVMAATEMIEMVSKVDCSGLILPGDQYNIGIGVDENEAIIGNIGPPEKSEYTAIGNVIGFAEELEGNTKVFNRKILVSRQVYLKTKVKLDFETILKEGENNSWPEGLYSPLNKQFPKRLFYV